MAPALYNVGQIFGALVLAPRFGVHGLVYGVIIGAVLHLGIQVPALIKYQFHWTPSLDLRAPGMADALRMVGPRLLTMFMIQLMFISRDNLASRLDQVGAISSLTYGWMIMQVPETLLGTAIATALLPTLSELAARGDWTGFRQTIERALRVLIALTLPIAAVIAAGLRPLVAFTFGFDTAGTDLLTWTTRIYLLTLTGYAVQELMARAFYARKEPWIPFYGVAIRLVIYLILGIAALRFFPQIGAPAIAVAELSLAVEAFIMLTWLNRRLPRPTSVAPAVLKGVAALIIGGGTAYGLAVYLPGSALLTAMLGMLAGAGLALFIVRREAGLLFKL
jgi:putative peptidoglycan lipid II flippase